MRLSNPPISPDQAYDEAVKMRNDEWEVIRVNKQQIGFFIPPAITALSDMLKAPVPTPGEATIDLLGVSGGSRFKSKRLYLATWCVKTWRNWKRISKGDIVRFEFTEPVIGRENAANYLKPVLIRKSRTN